MSTGSGADVRTVKVWDILVRVFHWTVVVGFFIAYFTEGEPLWIHVWAGYVVCAMVLLRILWGFIGSRHARFSDFVFPLRRVFSDLNAAVRLRAPRFIGHSPAGGAMIVALLLMLSGTTLAGMTLYAVDKGKGPLSYVIDREPHSAVFPSPGVAASSDTEKEPKGSAVEFWEEAHEILGNLTLFLVFLHVGGVALASFSHRENLVRAMIDGRKRPLS